ncbi:MAG: hypothetical protein GX153_02335 [Clostridiaceae bacterium]|nr:hypothetical protein [Clostridiaceae bacterium]
MTLSRFLPITGSGLTALSSRFDADADIRTAFLELAEQGFPIAPADAARIIDGAIHILARLGRVEFGSWVLCEVLRRCGRSAHVQPDSLMDTAEALYEVFHETKSQTNDLVSDDELLDAVFMLFERYSGSIELVVGKGVEQMVENHRRGVPLAVLGPGTPDRPEEGAW